jgi:hypothetical protein
MTAPAGGGGTWAERRLPDVATKSTWYEFGGFWTQEKLKRVSMDQPRFTQGMAVDYQTI